MSNRNITHNRFFSILRNVLNENGITNNLYSFNGYSEGKVCLEKDKDEWLVYIGERGSKNRIMRFTSQILAAYEIIDLLSDNTELQRRITMNLLARLKKEVLGNEPLIAKIINIPSELPQIRAKNPSIRARVAYYRPATSTAPHASRRKPVRSYRSVQNPLGKTYKRKEK